MSQVSSVDSGTSRATTESQKEMNEFVKATTPNGEFQSDLKKMIFDAKVHEKLQLLLRADIGGGVCSVKMMAANFTSRAEVDNWVAKLMRKGALPDNFNENNRKDVTALWMVARDCVKSYDKDAAEDEAMAVADAAKSGKTDEKNMPAKEMQAMYLMWFNKYDYPLTAEDVVSTRGMKKILDMMEKPGNLFCYQPIKDFKRASLVLSTSAPKKTIEYDDDGKIRPADDDEDEYKTKFFHTMPEYWKLLEAYLKSIVVLTMYKKIKVTRAVKDPVGEEVPFMTYACMMRYLKFLNHQVEQKNVNLAGLIYAEEKIRIEIAQTICNGACSKCETFEDTEKEWAQWANQFFKMRERKTKKGGKNKKGDGDDSEDDGGQPRGKNYEKNKRRRENRKKREKEEKKKKGKDGKVKKHGKKNTGGKKKSASESDNESTLSSSLELVEDLEKEEKMDISTPLAAENREILCMPCLDVDAKDVLAKRKKGKILYEDDGKTPNKKCYGEGPWKKLKRGPAKRKHGEDETKCHVWLHELACTYEHGPRQHCKFKDTCQTKVHDVGCGARLENGKMCKCKKHTAQQHFRAMEDGLASTLYFSCHQFFKCVCAMIS